MKIELEEQPKAGDDKDVSNSSISSPDLDPQTAKPRRKAISSFNQAHAIAKALKQKAEDGRLGVAAKIVKRYNGEQPFSADELRKAGQHWRNNFSTRFLASIVDRITPQIKDPLVRADLLTHSALPAKYPDASKKSRFFCEQITKVIRGWHGWADFVSLISQDNVLHGIATPAWIDDDWRPKAFRYEESLFPEKTGQNTGRVQLAVFTQKIMLHELLDRIEDKEIARDAGYDIEGCVKAINAAAGIGENAAEETEIEKADSVRETGVAGMSYTEKAKTVDVFHVLVREHAGGVALWTVEQASKYAIRKVEKLHGDTKDALAIFTLQTGNGNLYGSLGIGRMLANIHTAIERLRCLGADQSYLAGLLVLKADSSAFNRIQPTVRHPFILIDEGTEVSNEQVRFEAESYRLILQDLIATAESIAGAFIPPNIDNRGSSNTKIEAAQKAERELSVKQGVQGRFFSQFAELTGSMQRKICSADNIREAIRIFEERKAQTNELGAQQRLVARDAYELIKQVVPDAKEPPKTVIGDPEAVDAIVTMLEEGLTVEEIAMLAVTPAGSNVQDNSAERDANTVGFLDANAGNPYIDQHEGTRIKAEIVVGRDRANRLVLEDNPDPNLAAVQSRMQIIEFGHMFDGMGMPVASTDNHRIHRVTLLPLIQPKMQLVQEQPTPEVSTGLRLSLQHYIDHVQMDPQMPEEAKNDEMEVVKQMMAILDAADQAIEQAAQIEAQQAQEQAGQQQQPGPGGQVDPKLALDGLAQGAEIARQQKDQELRERELALSEEQHKHRVGMDIAGMQQDATGAVIEQARAEREDGLREAELDRVNQPV